MLRIEIGGGANPRAGFINVDKCPSADKRCDLAVRPLFLPFADESAAEVYSAHCLEHIADYRPVLQEITRICQIGAKVEIRVPHWLHPQAMCFDHKVTFSPQQIDDWCKNAIWFWFPKEKGEYGGPCERRLYHTETERIAGPMYEIGKRAFPWMNHEERCETFPGACIEYRFHFTVIPND